MTQIRKKKLEDLRSKSTDEDNEDLRKHEAFKVSVGWLQGFKSRFSLVSLRATTNRAMAENYQEVCYNFIKETQQIISTKSIKPRNIINFDQVPRYFEMESGSTITVKGSRKVLLKKSSSSHKRFTFTPAVNAHGEFVALHVLFSKLKKVPAVIQNCIADVNVTGMWSQKIL